MIPVRINRTGKTFYVGVWRGRGSHPTEKTVEEIITRALQEVKAEKATPLEAEKKMQNKKETKDLIGKVQMSTDTFAIIGENRKEVKETI